MTTACIIAAVCILVAGLFAVIVERTNERDEAMETARQAVEQAETFADEAKATHEANMLLVAELAASDEKIRSLSNALMAAQTALSDASGGNVIPLPQREKSPYDWPEIARAVAREASPIHDDLAVETFVESIERWGEEAES